MRKIGIFSIIFCLAAAIVFGAHLIVARQMLDNQGPVITMESDTVEISVEDELNAILEGVTAVDQQDGDVSQYLVVERLENFLEKGRRQATVVAFDTAGNVTKNTRSVVYTDYESPRFAISEPFIFPEGTSDVTKYLSAQDCLDGDITSKIKLSSESGITTSRAGVYDAVFTASNSAGDTVKLPVTIEIYNSSDYSRLPKILLSEYLVYVEKDSVFDPKEYIKEIYYGNVSYVRNGNGELQFLGEAPEGVDEILNMREVVIENPVKTSEAGVYEVNYSYSWENSLMGSTRLIVVVTE